MQRNEIFSVQVTDYLGEGGKQVKDLYFILRYLAYLWQMKTSFFKPLEE